MNNAILYVILVVLFIIIPFIIGGIFLMTIPTGNEYNSKESNKSKTTTCNNNVAKSNKTTSAARPVAKHTQNNKYASSKEKWVFENKRYIIYFVYRYTFPDGTTYIGRSNNKCDRYGDIDHYKNQKVYKQMLKYPDFKKEIIFYNTDLYQVAELEHKMIVSSYNNNWNVCKEYDWKDKVTEYLAEKKY